MFDLSGRTALVTGATGFAGSSLLPTLVADGHELRAFARDPSRVAHAVPTARTAFGDEVRAASAA